MGSVSHRLAHKESYCASESMKSARCKPNTWGGRGHVTSRGGRVVGWRRYGSNGWPRQDGTGNPASSAVNRHFNRTQWSMGKEENTVGKRELTLPLVWCSAVNQYTGNGGNGGVGTETTTWSYCSIPIPILVRTVWKCGLTWEWGRGDISKYQSISWLAEIIEEPKHISLFEGPLAHVDPITNLPSCPPGSFSPVHSPNPARQSDTSSGNSTPPPPPTTLPAPNLSSACLPVCLSAMFWLQAQDRALSWAALFFYKQKASSSPLHSSSTSVGLKTYKWRRLRSDWQVLMVMQVNLFFTCRLLIFEPCPNQSPLTAHWAMFCLPLRAPVTGTVSDWGWY